jgi:hypothetical protein
MKVVELPVKADDVVRHEWILTMKNGSKIAVVGTEAVVSFDSEHPSYVVDKINKKEVIVFASKSVVCVELADRVKKISTPKVKVKRAV